MSTNNHGAGIKTYLKGLGFEGFAIGSNTAEVDVKDGKILRIRPLNYTKEYQPEEFNPWQIKARGKVFKASMKSLLPPFSLVYKKRAYSPNRVLYPLKRIDWDPNGDRDLIASELKRQYKEYGNYSILAQGDGHGETKAIHGPHGCQMDLLELMGGYTLQARNTDSWEGWAWGAKHVWGQDPVGQGDQANLWKDISEHTQMMLFWGADPETTPWGWGGLQASRLCYWFTELGIKSIYICPDLNYGAAVHADKWIPVLPNTDSALQLAIAYTWIMENSYDKEYLATHSIGFDQFKSYVLGEDDGIPKTPVWAAKITGVPSRIIKALARKWAKEATSIGHCNGGSFIRSTYSHEPARLEVCLLAMQGLGKPGQAQLKFLEWQQYSLHRLNPAPRSKVIPNVKACYHGWKYQIPPQFIPKTLIAQAILSDEPLKWYGTSCAGVSREDQFLQYEYPIEEGGSEIHMIWTDTPCWTTCWNGGNQMIEALRSAKIECVVAQHPWLENDCLFADIILPINTKFEETDISADTMSGLYNHLVFEGQCIEPLGESKSDYEAVCEVAKKVGLFEQYTQGKSIEDNIKDAFDDSGIAGMISYDDFRKKEYFMVPTAEDWEDDPPGFSKFYKDPASHPLSTPSGLLEFYSEDLAEYFPDDQERSPVPHWIPYGESHQESLLHPRSEKFPYLIVSNHPRWRVHANLDDISWLREIPTCKVRGSDGYLYEPVWINPLDAAKLGVVSGDVVKVLNDRGFVLGGAYVTERIMPGVVYQDHGARLDPIVPGESDRGGANNLICPTAVTSKNCVGEVTSGYLVNIEKADIAALHDQHKDAFSRKYDPASGVCIESWIEGGKWA